jgi:hypothetical protein
MQISLARNLEKQVMFLYMGAWLWTQRRYDMNGRSQMQGGENWIFPKEINANRFF